MVGMCSRSPRFPMLNKVEVRVCVGQARRHQHRTCCVALQHWRGTRWCLLHTCAVGQPGQTPPVAALGSAEYWQHLKGGAPLNIHTRGPSHHRPQEVLCMEYRAASRGRAVWRLFQKWLGEKVKKRGEGPPLPIEMGRQGAG